MLYVGSCSIIKSNNLNTKGIILHYDEARIPLATTSATSI